MRPSGSRRQSYHLESSAQVLFLSRPSPAPPDFRLLATALAIRYPLSRGEFRQVGFLALDSQQENAFPDAPDIFDFRNPGQSGEFHANLDSSILFHVGAMIADTLSMALRPYLALITSGQREKRQIDNQPTEIT